VNFQSISDKPTTASLGEICWLLNLWYAEHPLIERPRLFLSARRHRQLHVFNSRDAHQRPPESIVGLL